jgi:sialate O-acetylesterase
MARFLRLLAVLLAAPLGFIQQGGGLHSQVENRPSGVAATHIKVHYLFSDNMVFQQGRAIPVWGTADPGGVVKVSLSGNRREAVVGRDGRWRVELPPVPYRGPHELCVFGADTLVFYNVMMGEVWLCSGQSNMAMPVSGSGQVLNYQEEVAGAHYPEIRLLTIPNMQSRHPLDTLAESDWEVCSPRSVAEFSAAAYFFGRHLYKHLLVPVGLICASWGGTPVESWTSGDSLKGIPEFAEAIGLLERDTPDGEYLDRWFATQLDEWEQAIRRVDPDYGQTSGVSWWDPKLEDSAWKRVSVPSLWEGDGMENFDGFVWYRKRLNLPASWAGADLTLNTGPIDDEDVVWFNGQEIGGENCWDCPRSYRVAAPLVRQGENVIAVRVLDTGGPGGMTGTPDEWCLTRGPHDTLSLAGLWSYRISTPLEKLPPRPTSPDDATYPSTLYNGMIAPLIPFPIRGVIWYQGEANALRAYRYRTLFPLLINDWRARWHEGDFPFLFVQLANYSDVVAQPGEASWAELREAQLKTLALKNTGMAVAIDIGDASDIHPKNKQEVGDRLGLIARAVAYGEGIESSGPLYRGMTVEGSRVRLEFDHSQSGLMARGGGELRGFAVAGLDRKFHWADAVIDGRTVLVSSPEVPVPVAVRYAWATNPVCNLCNAENLPASPFRTDAWPGITDDAR